MSSIRGIGDGYAFQRLLWLLIGTIIVPTVLLSLFGVMAIRNQRAALVQRLDQERTDQLEIAAVALLGEVEALEIAMVGHAQSCHDVTAACQLSIPGTQQAWTWLDGEAVPPDLQSAGVARGVGDGDEVVWVSPVDRTAPLAVVADEERRFAWRLEAEALQAQLRDRVGKRLPDVTVLLLEAPATGSSLEDVVARLFEPAITVLSLPPPLGGWRLRITGDDPTRALLRRDAWLYPATLVFLVGLVVVGSVFTFASARREIRLSRLQTDFVSSVSHELRTPLTSIRLFVETLQSGRLHDPDKVQECLDLLAQESDRLQRMIERVLDWARMEAGRRVYDFAPVAPADLAHATLRTLKSHNLLTDEPIDLQLGDDLPEIHADTDAIVEALLNLLQNALKNTPTPRRIVLSASRAGRGVALAVSDNGPGIHKQHHRRIFEKFYQVDARLSAPTQGRVDRGSGLGLSIVRAVARAHGGRVEVESEPSRGATFTLWLPAPRGVR